MASYFVASGLRGFAASTLRVRVTRWIHEAGLAQIVSADLRDSGHGAIVRIDQLAPEGVEHDARHRDGLVSLGG